MVSPVYLGWSEVGKDKMFREKAEQIFIKTRNDYNGNYLKQEFTDNSFYHPQYLMSYGRNRQKSVLIINAFCQNTNEPKCTISPFMEVTISKSEVCENVLSRLKADIFDENSLVEKQEPKLYRFKLNDELILTITSKEQGYIAIRGIDKNNDLTDKYSQILKRLEFLPLDKVWLGKKNFKAFGNSVEEVVNTIVEEVSKIKKEIEMI